MRPIDLFLISVLLVVTLTQIGCASFNRKLKSFLGGKNQEVVSKSTTFSENPDMPPNVRRQYKRTTKESLADSSALDAKSGSLWVMEGQGAYLFSQNIMRLVGDPLAVTIEGDPKDQLQSKTNVIKKLLAKIEERRKARLRNLAAKKEGAENEKADGESGDEKSKDKGGKEKDQKTAGNQQNQEKSFEEELGDFNVKTVPTRIIERTLEGNYRVKGSQAFMIGTREYKVIVTGIVRAEDFNDEGIPATKLLDAKFDIVNARGTGEAM